MQGRDPYGRAEEMVLEKYILPSVMDVLAQVHTEPVAQQVP